MSERQLYSRLVRVASELPKGDPTRRKLLAMLRGGKARNLVDAYSEDYEVRDLNYRDRAWMSPGQWQKVMMEALAWTGGDYNAFNARKVGNWLKGFKGIKVQGAREYSVAVYIKGDQETLETIKDEAWGDADEADFERDGTLRLWWD